MALTKKAIGRAVLPAQDTTGNAPVTQPATPEGQCCRGRTHVIDHKTAADCTSSFLLYSSVVAFFSFCITRWSITSPFCYSLAALNILHQYPPRPTHIRQDHSLPLKPNSKHDTTPRRTEHRHLHSITTRCTSPV